MIRRDEIRDGRDFVLRSVGVIGIAAILLTLGMLLLGGLFHLAGAVFPEGSGEHSARVHELKMARACAGCENCGRREE